MATLSSANTKYTAEQIAKVTGVSTETLANWGLVKSTDTLTISELAEKAASDTQAKTALDKIIIQNAQAVANGEVTISNAKLTASEAGATIATGSFTTAIKANIASMLTWMTTNPLGWLSLLVAGIFAAVKAYDALTVSVEEQKEKMEESLSAYDDVKSELSNITTELENQKQAMDELLAKDKLTYAEKEQLEELQAITQELRIQKDLAEKEESKTQKEVAKDASDLYKKQFGGYDISESAVDEYYKKSKEGSYSLFAYEDNDNLSAMIAGYKQLNEELDKAYESRNQESIDQLKSDIEDVENLIFTTAQDLQKQQDNISDYYNTIKDTPYEDLTTEQKEIVDSYNAISNAIALIYKQLDPNTWNSMQIDNLFATDGIEKTKEELIAMAKEGTLDENVIRSYSKLNSTLEDSNMVLSDGQSAASALCDEMYALADAENSVQGSTSNETNILSYDVITETAESATESVDTLRSAISSVNDAFTEQSESGSISIDTMLSLVNAGYATALQFDAVTGACTINKEAMLDLVQAKIQNQIADLQLLQSNIQQKLADDGNTARESANGFYDLAKAKLAAATAEQLASMKQFNDAEAQINALQNASKNIDKIGVGSYSTKPRSSSSSKSSSSSTAPIKEAFQAEYDTLKHNLEMEYITEKQYYDSLAALNQKYFAGKAEYLDEYRQYEEEVCKGLKSYYTDYIDSQMDLLESQSDAGSINYVHYSSTVKSLLDNMYADSKISAEDYHSYIKQMLEKQLDIYDKALSAVTRRFDAEIDKINESIDGIEIQNEALENQLDNYDSILSVIDSVYEAEIDRIQAEQDAIQDTIDALQDENDERELALKLEEARWALYKAQTQRTKKVFNGTEFVYEADRGAIRDAQENLSDLELE